jgi:hypothetical protein
MRHREAGGHAPCGATRFDPLQTHSEGFGLRLKQRGCEVLVDMVVQNRRAQCPPLRCAAALRGALDRNRVDTR